MTLRRTGLSLRTFAITAALSSLPAPAQDVIEAPLVRLSLDGDVGCPSQPAPYRVVSNPISVPLNWWDCNTGDTSTFKGTFQASLPEKLRVVKIDVQGTYNGQPAYYATFESPLSVPLSAIGTYFDGQWGGTGSGQPIRGELYMATRKGGCWWNYTGPVKTATISMVYTCTNATDMRLTAYPDRGVWIGALTGYFSAGSNGLIGATHFVAEYELPMSKLDPDPSVVPNAVEKGKPVTVKVAVATGSGSARAALAEGPFKQGATVKIGRTTGTGPSAVNDGDVKVVATRYVSSSVIEVDVGDFVDLPEGKRDIEVTNPDGSKISTKEAFFVSDLLILPPEVNQGVPMDCTSARPCIANHDTVVRARAVCNATTCGTKTTVAALLHVTQGGSPIAGSPFAASPGSLTLKTLREALNADFSRAEQNARWRGEDALNFPFLTRLLPAGTYELTLEVDGRKPETPPTRASAPNLKTSLVKKLGPLTFRTSTRSLNLAVLVECGTLGSCSSAAFQRALADSYWAKAAYPISKDRITFTPVSATLGFATAMLFPETYAIWQTQMKLRQFYWTQKLLFRGYDGILFFTDSKYFTDRGTTDAGPSSDGKAWEVIAPTSIVSIRPGVGTAVPRTIAHELGHQFLLGDTYWGGGMAGPYNPPDATCAARLTGCPVEDGHFDTTTGTVSTFPPVSRPKDNDTVKSDFMGGADTDKSWVDRRSWNLLYSIFNSAAPSATTVARAAGDWLLVTAIVKEDGTADLLPFTRYSGPKQDGDTSSGPYVLEVLGASGQLLSSTSVDARFTLLHSPSVLPFGSLTRSVPAAGASRVVLRKGGREIASRKVSPNAPTVRVDFPSGGETLGGTATIRWTGADVDGDALTYVVAYSADGTSFTTIASDVSGSSMTWDTSRVAATSTGRIQVIASDGANQSVPATSGTFRIGAKGPAVSIESPTSGAVFAPGQLVELRGFGWDAEDGELGANALSFTSSRDGALGPGPLLETARLSTGHHTITLSGVDRDGNRATASIELTVFSASPSSPFVTSFVPIVLSTAGLGGSFFTSELTLTNRGSSEAILELDYTAAFGGGSGSATVALPAGQQRVIPDAITYLQSLGVPLPETGNRGGTLRVRSYNTSSPSAVAATIRTTTAVGQGRAGLSYPAIPPGILTGTAYLCGLRQTETDRSNLALLNVGGATAGEIVLRPTAFSGDPSAPLSRPLPDVTLAPGGFAQVSQVLASNGLSLTNGYVKVERVSGTAPFYAYAVINDQANSDGSFVPPVTASGLAGRKGITLPVAVEAGPFTTELVLTNYGTAPRTVRIAFVADAVAAAGNEAVVNVTLRAGEQRVIPSFVDFLREQGAPGVASGTFAGPVFVTVASGDVSGLSVGARTSAPGGGGRYGLFYSGVPFGSASTTSAWLYGLQQDGENRTNVALVNTGEADGSPDALKVEIYDGASGGLVNVVDATVGARRFTQLNSILKGYAPGVSAGYARVVRTAGTNPFIAYAVINDGGEPLKRSDDGAFVAMDLAESVAPPAISVSSSSLDFGSVPVGQSADRTLDVANGGGGMLRVSSLSLAGPAFALKANPAPFSVAPAGRTTLTLRFAPLGAGAASGTLTISSDDPSRPSLTVALSGSGAVAGAPRIEVSPASLAFGRVNVGSSRDLSFTLRSTGTAPLVVSTLFANHPAYTVTAPSLPVSIPPGGQLSVPVRFAPLAAGVVSISLAIGSNDPAAPIVYASMTGEGVAGTTLTEELVADDGTIESGFLADGTFIVNRLTPARYPATLKAIRLYLVPYDGLPSPTGTAVRVVAFVDPTGSGIPGAVGGFAVDQSVTLPAPPAGGGWIDLLVTNGPVLPSGDVYVGLRPPSASSGVAIPADTNGSPRRRGYLSTDGVSFQGPLVLVDSHGVQTDVNVMIRALVSEPGP